MMRGLVVGPTQCSSTAVRPVHTDNDLLDLGHAVTHRPASRGSYATAQPLAEVPRSTVVTYGHAKRGRGLARALDIVRCQTDAAIARVLGAAQIELTARRAPGP